MTNRLLTAHMVKVADELVITVADEPGPGGANHLYMIEGFDTASNASDPFVARHGQSSKHTTIIFQNGTVPEKGANGITIEALLAIAIDRLTSFQAGPFRSAYNANALEHCQAALNALKERTMERMSRKVEGTHEV